MNRHLTAALLSALILSTLILSPTAGRADGGFALSLDAGRKIFEETVAGGWSFVLRLTNASAKRRCTLVPKVMLAHQARLEITDARGHLWSVTYLPPPMPRPGWPPKPRRRCLPAGGSVAIGLAGSISGFNRVKPRQDRWYRQPPAGAYAVRAKAVVLPGQSGKLTSAPVTIRVQAADKPVKGLQLKLEAKRPWAGKAGPAELRLVFINVGRTPLSIDLHDLLWSRLSARLNGPSHSGGGRKRVRAPARRAADTRRIAAGQRLVSPVPIRLPGPMGPGRHELGAKGWFQVRVVYSNKRDSNKRDSNKRGAPVAWVGEVSSNMLWFENRALP
jgi:hypothetical protein